MSKIIEIIIKNGQVVFLYDFSMGVVIIMLKMEGWVNKINDDFGQILVQVIDWVEV